MTHRAERLTMTKAPSPQQLSDEFCRILNDWLGPSEIQEINRRNTLPEFARATAKDEEDGRKHSRPR